MKTKLPILTVAVAFWAASDLGAAVRVSALHPVLADLARQVGGEDVAVVNVMKPGADPHDFAPTPSDLAAMGESPVILAMGKGIEPYLPKLKSSLRGPQRLVEVGATIPSLTIGNESEAIHDHDRDARAGHGEGAVDPHWWTSIANMKRAARVVAKALGEADPGNAAGYSERAKVYGERLDALAKWARGEIARIPRRDRILATSHLAFGYFCREFGFRAIGVRGLTTEQEASVKHIAEAIAALKREKVKAVFPEKTVNPKVLQRMAKEAGVRVGGQLDPAFTGGGERATYESIMRRNVSTIVEALK